MGARERDKQTSDWDHITKLGANFMTIQPSRSYRKCNYQRLLHTPQFFCLLFTISQYLPRRRIGHAYLQNSWTEFGTELEAKG
jgi:hypothetical protein